MDPLSVTVATTALIATMGAVARYIRQLHQIPFHVARILRDVQQFRIELELLSRQLRNPQIATYLRRDHVEPMLADTQSTVGELHGILERLISENGTQLEVRRFAWLRFEKRCQELQLRLAENLERLMRLNHLASANLIVQVLSSTNLRLLQPPQTHMQEPGVLSRLSLDETLYEEEPSDTTLLTAGPRQAQVTLLTASTTSVIGSHISTGLCVCQCHKRKYDALRRHIKTRLQPLSLSIATRCTNFECCARWSCSRSEILVPVKWLRKLVIFSAMTRKSDLRNSLTLPVVITAGSDAERYAITGNIEGLRRLFTNGITTPSAKTSDGWTLLHTAAYYGHLEVVKFLIDQSADINATEDGRRTAADLARVRALVIGCSEIRKEIANQFSDAEDFKITHALSPVHIALLGLYDHDDKGRPDLPSLLEFIDDAENAPPGTNWRTFKAMERKRSPLFEDIIQRYAKRDQEPEMATSKKTHIIDNPDEIHGWSPLLWAAYTGRRKAMETLIDSDADPFIISKMGRYLLHLAAESKSSEVMSFVLKIPDLNGQWFDINRADYWQETPLHIAASGSAECVRMLLERGADPASRNDVNQIPLHYASLATNGQEKLGIVDHLSAVNHGSHVNFKDKEGRTPLFELLDSPESVEMLVRRGADLSICDKKGSSLLHLAALEDRMDSLRILLKNAPASLATAADEDCNTPISLAFECGNAACAKLLVEQNALGDFHGKGGLKLVHHAAKWGDADVLEAVLKHSSFQRGAKTPNGRSAADLAKSEGKWKGRVKKLLKEYDSRGRVAVPSYESREIRALALAEYLLVTR